MKDLEKQLAEERRVAKLAREFLALEVAEIDEGIERGLAEAAGIAGVDRCYLVAMPGRRGGEADRYEWVQEGISSRRLMERGSQMLDRHGWLAAQLAAGRLVHIARVDDLPPEAFRLRDVLRESGVASCLMVPLGVGRAALGVIGFEYHRAAQEWSESQLARLELVAELFTSLVRRKREEEARLESERALQRQLALEQQIADLSRYVVQLEPSRVAEGIRDKLPELALLARAEHIALFSLESRSLETADLFEWWADGAPEWSRDLTPRHGRFPYAGKILGQGLVHHVASLDDLPAEALAERRDLEQRGVRSQLVIPLFSERRFSGSLSVECLSYERRWTDEDITLMRLAGEILAGALRRRHAAEELRESQALLLQSQKMEAVGTLAGGIAHDFNNQLAVMLGNARFVLEGLKDQPDIGAALEDIERAAEHCARLTEGLLAFSRRRPVEDRPLEIPSLLRDVQGLVTPLLPATIRLEVRPGDEGDWIRADAIQLQQVLINLIVNARDAMPNGGRLAVGARRRRIAADEAASLGLASGGTYVDVSVADEGIGMSPDVAGRVFEPFFTTKEVGEGTGLGLATAYGIVQQSGGKVTLESELGAGSTFHVLLPAIEPERAAGEPDAPMRPLEARGTVLLVEDEAAVRRVVMRMLAGLGFVVIEAEDGQTGLRIARERLADLDLLITDLSMPHTTGVELAGELAFERPDLPILFLSGYSDGRAEAATQQLERAFFLQKPFDVSGLSDALQQLLGPSD